MSKAQTTAQLQKWLDIISAYDNEFKKWEARAKKILKRYRDDDQTPADDRQAKFNILWSNVQTLIPAVYARMPKADVARRFGDNDQLGRVSSLLIERALDYEIEHFPDFRAAMRNAVEDRFLGGRGVVWVRYEPHLTTQGIGDDGSQVTEDVESEKAEEVPEQIDYECSPADYVHWRDFGHSIARTWEEVTCVWRWVYMTKDALADRFGEDIAKKIPMGAGPKSLNDTDRNTDKEGERAKICELWDKESGKAYWLCKSYPDIIDERDDPLGLEGFFPCPKPLYATTTTDTLVPVPDFALYQDQARELDILSDRIDGLVKALRVRGVYDQSVPALQRLLTEGDNNTLVPVETWGAFAEKGGLKGAIDLLPLDALAEALLNCYRARDDIKAQIYEITGISDIIRGQTEATETATAQQIKGQYATLRLKSMQESVAMFATELLRIKAQIICSKYQPQTILSYAAAGQMAQADQEMIPQAMQLIRDKPLRSFRVDVAADSLVQLDENQNKQERMEFLQAFGNFLKEAIPAGTASPEMVPMLMELAKYAVGGFKQARSIEGAIDQALEAMKKKAQQAAMQPPKPDPEMAKVQAEAQANQARAQADAQVKQMQAQIDMQIEQMRARMEMQIEQQRLGMEEQARMREAQMEQRIEWMKAQLDAATKITVAEIGAQANAEQAAQTAENTVEQDLSR